MFHNLMYNKFCMFLFSVLCTSMVVLLVGILVFMIVIGEYPYPIPRCFIPVYMDQWLRFFSSSVNFMDPAFRCLH